jgi:hypothetical protein
VETENMTKTLLAFATATTIAAAALAAPNPADARCFGCAVGVGVIGGLAAGAIIGSAIASAPPPGYAYAPYAPVTGYVAYPEYAAAVPVGCPGGYWARRPRHDPYGNVIGWSRPRFVCPY